MKSKAKISRKYTSWKEFLLEKFGDENLFKLQLRKRKDSPIEDYTVSTKIGKSKTEIKFSIFKDTLTEIELMEIYFNCPLTLKEDNSYKPSLYKFKWQSFKYYDRNFEALEKWLEIPLYHGWLEHYTFFGKNLVQRIAFWGKNRDVDEFILPKNQIKSYGLIQLLVLPIIIIYNWTVSLSLWKFNKKEKWFPPMISC